MRHACRSCSARLQRAPSRSGTSTGQAPPEKASPKATLAASLAPRGTRRAATAPPPRLRAGPSRRPTAARASRQHQRHQRRALPQRAATRPRRPGAEGEGHEVARDDADAEQDLPPAAGRRDPCGTITRTDRAQRPQRARQMLSRDQKQRREPANARGTARSASGSGDGRGPDEAARHDPRHGECTRQEAEQHDLPRQPLDHHGLRRHGKPRLAAAPAQRGAASPSTPPGSDLVDHLRQVIFADGLRPPARRCPSRAAVSRQRSADSTVCDRQRPAPPRSQTRIGLGEQRASASRPSAACHSIATAAPTACTRAGAAGSRQRPRRAHVVTGAPRRRPAG